MKRKIIFLCMLLGLIVSSNNNLQSKVSNSTLEETHFLLDNLGRFNKPIFMNVVEKCVHCGRKNSVSPDAPMDTKCQYCGKLLFVQDFYRYHCVNCGAENDSYVGAPMDTKCSECEKKLFVKMFPYKCYNCWNSCEYYEDEEPEEFCSECGTRIYNTIEFEATYKVGLYEMPLFGCTANLYIYETNELIDSTFIKFDKDKKVGKGLFKIENEYLRQGKVTENTSLFIGIFAGNDNVTVQVPLDEWTIIDYAEWSDRYCIYEINHYEDNKNRFKNTMLVHPYVSSGTFKINNLNKKYVFTGPKIEIDTSIDDVVNKAFFVAQNVIRASNYVSNNNIKPEPVNVLCSFRSLSDDSEKTSYYCSSEKRIYINLKNKSLFNPMIEERISADTIIHEYGHHIQYFLDTISYTGYDGAHMHDENQINKITPKGQKIGKEEGKCIAWAEAWATVFSKVVQDYCISSEFNVEIRGTNESAFGGTFSGGYDLENNNSREGYVYKRENGKIILAGLSSFSGEGCQLTIEQILWDIFDGRNLYDGSGDGIYLKHKEWFEVTTKSEKEDLKLYSFENFCINFCEKYKDDEDKLVALKKLLNHHRIEYQL